MEEIQFSVMSYDTSVSDLQAVVQEFEAQHRVRVQIQRLNWETSWAEIMKFAADGYGPAVSEVGDTWIASLAKMNVLRPFTASEAAAMDGPAAFLPATWQSGFLPDSTGPWGIPWLAETRVIFYRRDLLQAAGVDERTAFQTNAHLEQTLERLQTSGVSVPWVVPTRPTLNTFHHLTSWIWGAGGDFVDEHHRLVTFAEAPARAGVRAYYNLYRFLAPQARQLDSAQAGDLFATGQAAVTLDGPWLLVGLSSPFAPDALRQVGVASPPGVPCVLASHLVVWKHVDPWHEKLAVELVRFLTSKPVQFTCSQQVGLLPVRLDVLANSPFADPPVYSVISCMLKVGRSFPAMRLWGSIEGGLTMAFGNLWAKVLATPDPDLDALIRAELAPLAQRLNIALQ